MSDCVACQWEACSCDERGWVHCAEENRWEPCCADALAEAGVSHTCYQPTDEELAAAGFLPEDR